MVDRAGDGDDRAELARGLAGQLGAAGLADRLDAADLRLRPASVAISAELPRTTAIRSSASSRREVSVR